MRQKDWGIYSWVKTTDMKINNNKERERDRQREIERALRNMQAEEVIRTLQ